ncbi:mannose-1-phosphate guanylyltransferase [Coprobacter sp.]
MKNRYCVIMAGGIGSRFWPVSRTNRPKQFLDFFGTGHTLLQLTYERFCKIIPFENIFIVTNEQYADLVKQQIPEIDDEHVLLEPQRRNTAPCIAWAAYHIQAINPDANIVVTPSDHLILKENAFSECITKGLQFVESFPALLTLGVKPNRPETGYGYIQVGDESNGDIKTVKTFTEKPNHELAEIFVESGEFFWNSGIFIWNVQTIIKAFQRHLPEVSARFESGNGKFNTSEEKIFIQENFPACQNISIDFGLMEKASNVFVLCADFGWADVGTWGSLYDISNKDKNGNVGQEGKSLIYESDNNIITVPNDKLVVIEGLKNYIIADSDNVLLICRKDEEERIRQIVNDAKVKFGNEFI